MIWSRGFGLTAHPDLSSGLRNSQSGLIPTLEVRTRTSKYSVCRSEAELEPPVVGLGPGRCRTLRWNKTGSCYRLLPVRWDFLQRRSAGSAEIWRWIGSLTWVQEELLNISLDQNHWNFNRTISMWTWTHEQLMTRVLSRSKFWISLWSNRKQIHQSSFQLVSSGFCWYELKSRHTRVNEWLEAV